MTRRTEGPRVTVEEAVAAARRFFIFHAEAMTLQHPEHGAIRQHPELQRADVRPGNSRNRFEILMHWCAANRGWFTGRNARLWGAGPAADAIERKVREGARTCKEAWHAAIMIGCVNGRYAKREDGGMMGPIDDYLALTGWWWDVDWNAIVADIGPYPSGKAGPPTVKGTPRDALVCECIFALVEVGFYARRSDDKRKDGRGVTASSIVEEALRGTGLKPIKERTIETIWGKWVASRTYDGYEPAPWELSPLRYAFDEFGEEGTRLSEVGRALARERIANAKQFPKAVNDADFDADPPLRDPRGDRIEDD